MNQNFSFAQQRGEEEVHTNSDVNIKFYHIDTEISLDTTFISGNVYIEYLAVKDETKELTLDLNSKFKVSKIAIELLWAIWLAQKIA